MVTFHELQFGTAKDQPGKREDAFKRRSDGIMCRGVLIGGNTGVWTVKCPDGQVAKFSNIQDAGDPREFDIMSSYEAYTWKQEGEDMVFRWSDNGDEAWRETMVKHNEKHKRYSNDPEHAPKYTHP